MDIRKIRLKNLNDLIAERGSQREVSEATGIDSSYISQIKNPLNPKNIGEKLARKIEESMKLPRGWMDLLHDKATDHQSKAVDNEKLQENSALKLRTTALHEIPYVTWEELPTLLNSDNKKMEFKKMIVLENVTDNAFAVIISTNEHSPYAEKGESVIIESSMETLTKICLVEMNGHYSFMRHFMQDIEYLTPVGSHRDIPITETLNYKIIGCVAFIQPPCRKG